VLDAAEAVEKARANFTSMQAGGSNNRTLMALNLKVTGSGGGGAGVEVQRRVFGWGVDQAKHIADKAGFELPEVDPSVYSWRQSGDAAAPPTTDASGGGATPPAATPTAAVPGVGDAAVAEANRNLGITGPGTPPAGAPAGSSFYQLPAFITNLQAGASDVYNRGIGAVRGATNAILAPQTAPQPSRLGPDLTEPPPPAGELPNVAPAAPAAAAPLKIKGVKTSEFGLGPSGETLPKYRTFAAADKALAELKRKGVDHVIVVDPKTGTELLYSVK
jgi:hypothetical protein